MTESLVKLDNTMVWDGLAKPFFEAYHVKVCDPKAHWSLWLRYSLLNPQKAGFDKKAIAALEGIFFTHDAPAVLAAESFELADYDIVHTDHFISIGDSFLSLAQAVGLISDKKTFIKWEMNLEDPVLSFRPLPGEMFYHLPHPKAKFLVPRLTCRASGQIYINHKKFELHSQPLYQSHIFGKNLPSTWTWINCINFKEDSAACLEVLFLGLIPGVSKKAHLIFLRFDDVVLSANSIWDGYWANKVSLNETTCEMVITKHKWRAEICVTFEKRYENTVVYHGPDGQNRLSALNLAASADIKILKQKDGVWQSYKTLTARNTASIEKVSPTATPA